MKTAETEAEIFLMALGSLSKEEREIVIVHLLAGAEIREDIMDILTIQQRINKPSRPFRECLSEN